MILFTATYKLSREKLKIIFKEPTTAIPLKAIDKHFGKEI